MPLNAFLRPDYNTSDFRPLRFLPQARRHQREEGHSQGDPESCCEQHLVTHPPLWPPLATVLLNGKIDE